MQSSQPIAMIVAPPYRLAVDSENRLVHSLGLGRLRSQRRQPIRETGLKRRWLQERQHATKDIFARYAVGQLQNLHEQLFLHLGPLRNRGWTTRSRQHCHQSNDDHTDQRMLPIDRRTRIFQVIKMRDNLIQAAAHNLRHYPSSVNC